MHSPHNPYKKTYPESTSESNFKAPFYPESLHTEKTSHFEAGTEIALIQHEKYKAIYLRINTVILSSRKTFEKKIIENADLKKCYA